MIRAAPDTGKPADLADKHTMTHNLGVVLICGLLAFATGDSTAMTVTIGSE